MKASPLTRDGSPHDAAYWLKKLTQPHAIQTEFNWSGTYSRLERNFWEFHTRNPHVYELLVRYAREWRTLNRSKHCSIQLLFERVRWELTVHTDSVDFRINNNFAAFYARLIEVQERDLKDFFKLRKQRIPSSFGPRNESLPNGDHLA